MSTASNSITNVLNKREIEPLLLKAFAVMKTYRAATNTIPAVLDQTGQILADSLKPGSGNGVLPICELCKKQYADGLLQDSRYPCIITQLGGISKVLLAAQEAGGAYIYMCDFGLMFWFSPLYFNGRAIGALIAQGVLGIKRSEAAGKIAALSRGTLSATEAETVLADYPERSYEEIKALAQTLRFCTEQISRGTEDYYDTLKRKAEQDSRFTQQIHQIKNQSTLDTVPPYPLDQERMLLAALRRGDNEEGRKILAGILAFYFDANPVNFQRIQFQAIELMVLLSREAAAMDTTDAEEEAGILEANNRYIKRIQETKNMDELTHILHLIMERVASRLFSFQGIRHASALRKAERFIWENYTRKISLNEVASASGLSAPYFCSIFKEEMGENLSNYINRLRVEKAATLLAESDIPLNEIANASGFEDQSWFSKIFKSYMGINPGKYREQGKMIPTDLEQIEPNKEIS